MAAAATDGHTGRVGPGEPESYCVGAIDLFNRCLAEHRAVVLGFDGPRRCGKTTFVQRAAESLRDGRAPHGAVDAAAFVAEQVEDLLDALVKEFTRAPSDYGRVAFPRYLLGRGFLWSTIPPGKSVEEAARDYLRRPWPVDNLPRLFGDLTDAALVLFQLPGVGLGRLVLRPLVRVGLMRADTIVQKPGASWYVRNPLLNRSNTAEAGLAVLREWREAAGGLRIAADAALTAAFLADLRESADSGSWPAALGVLIDNADDSREAVWLVQALVRTIGPDDRTTVAVTHRGTMLAEVAAVLDGAQADPIAVRAADAVKVPPAETRWHPVRVPDLGLAAVRTLVEHATSWSLPDAHQAAERLYDLTRGHRGATMAACEALRGTPSPGPGSSWLREAADGDELIRSVTRTLDPAAVDLLVDCAAVRDLDHARVLVKDADTAGAEGVLRAELWVPGRAGRLVLLPPLRRFLLDRLRARPADEPGGWADVFGRLMKHAGADEESELYYRLALEEVEEVVGRLHERLAADKPEEAAEPEEWVELLRNVTRAPGRFAGPDAVLSRHTAWAAGKEPALRALADLVVRLWLDNDPFVPGDSAAAIAGDYGNLALGHPHAGPVLRVEQARWLAGRGRRWEG